MHIEKQADEKSVKRLLRHRGLLFWSFPEILSPNSYIIIMEAIGKMSARGKTISIDNYVVTHVACGGERIDNEIRKFYEANEMNRKISINHIECYSRGDPAGKVAGSITFFPKGQIPVSRMYGDDCSGWVFALFFELDRYQDIIDTLRYEKSVYVYVEWDENGVINHGWLSNSTSLKYKSW